MAIAYFHTWTTYGTWLPGDERGWYARHFGVHAADSSRRMEAELMMTESAITLSTTQRQIAEETVREHCRIRHWLLHALNCRSNHVHVVLTADGYDLKEPRRQLKAWATRRLKPTDPARIEWWTDLGWDVYIVDEDQLASTIEYVRNQ